MYFTAAITLGGEQMASGVYKIVNSVNGKTYYGSAFNLRARLTHHKSMLNRGQHKNPKLQAAWNKYGEKSFSMSVILICARKDVLFYEQRCLDIYDAVSTGYNISPTAGNTAGRKPNPEAIAKTAAAKRGVPMSQEARRNHALAMQSEEVRNRISSALKGVTRGPKTAEHLAKIVEANKGKKRTAEQRKRQSESMTGVSQGKRSEEAKARMSAAQKGRVISPEHAAAISVGRQRRYAELNAEKVRVKAEKAAARLAAKEERERIKRLKKEELLAKEKARADKKAEALKNPLKMTKVDGKWRQSEAFKQKLSEERKGKKFTEEHKEALRIARRKRAERERLAKLEGNA